MDTDNKNGSNQHLSVIRRMKKDKLDNLPLLPVADPSSTTLSARPERQINGAVSGDIPVDDNGFVSPETGGMSVTSKPESNLPSNLRKYPCFEIDVADLIENGLKLRMVNSTKGFIEPAYNMTMEQFQENIKSTRNDWKII